MDGPLVWAFVLLAIAVGILVVEFFVPSGGVLAIVAVAAFIGSVVVGFTVSVGWGVTMIALVSILVPISLSAAVRIWPRTRMGRRILNRIPGEPPPDVLPDDQRHQKLKSLPGQVGIAKTDLLPNGTIEIRGEKFDAVAASGAIDSGEAVEVIRIETGKIHVKATNKVPGSPAEQESQIGSASPLDRPIEELGIEGLEDPLS